MNKASLKQTCNYLGTHLIQQLIQYWVKGGTSADCSAHLPHDEAKTGDNQREKSWGQNAQVLVTVSQGLAHSGGLSSPFILLSGDMCVPLVRVQSLRVNATGQEASVRAQTAGPVAQCSRLGVSFSGGSKNARGKQAFPEVPRQGQNSRQRLRKRAWIKG